MNKLNLQDEISRVEKALAIAQQREKDISKKIVNKNNIEEPDYSDDDEPQQENTQEPEPDIQEQEIQPDSKPDIQTEEKPDIQTETEPDIQTESQPEPEKKKKRTKKSRKRYYSSSESESDSDDDQYTIEFVINRIHDQIKFFQKNIYRLITKYKNQVFDTEEIEELNGMYEEEEEDFHNAYDESIGILPIDVDLPEKFYSKFEKELEKITKKWNSFIQRLEIVK